VELYNTFLGYDYMTNHVITCYMITKQRYDISCKVIEEKGLYQSIFICFVF